MKGLEQEMLDRLSLVLPDLEAGIPPARILEERNLDWNPSYIPFLKRKARALGYEIPRSSDLYSQQKRVVKATAKQPTKSQVKQKTKKSSTALPNTEELTITYKGIKIIIPAGTNKVRILPDGGLEIY